MKNIETENLRRSPVVVVVGHVDHGKTTLLDYIRKIAAKAAPSGGEPRPVAGREAGGITQSVGAYEVVHNDRRITFIDTPGHEAFSKMRVRGALVADVAILVAAADEGVKPQTKEAIKVLKDSDTPFIVAITKIDKPNIDMEKVKNDLTANGVYLEGYGGNVSYHGVSAKTGEGVSELLDLILLASDMEDLKYDPGQLASGIVLETQLDNQRGNTVTVILKDGKLKIGDLIATPTAKGKIKNLENFLRKAVKEISPSSPAVILGFENLPQIGEEFKAGKLSEEDTAKVREIVSRQRERKIAGKEKNMKIVKVILKADVAGSLEALRDSLKKLSLNEGQGLDVVGESAGEISDGDVKNAIAMNAVIMGFRVRANKSAENLARDHGITIITDEIIYKLVEQIQKRFTAEQEQVKGELEVLALFSAKHNIQTIGGRVLKGQIRIKASFEIQREGGVMGQGRINSLQQNKKDINAVDTGSEAGLIVESDVKIAVGDRLLLKSHT